MSKKKIGIIIGTVVLIAAAAAGAWWKFGSSLGHDSKDRVYVQKVSVIMGSSAGMQNRYSGLVQPQKSVNINADTDRTIKEFFVKVGDTVEEGTPLFSYDTEEVELELQQAKLENENTDLEISSKRKQIEELKKERDAAPEGDKFEYTTQIQTIEAEIRQSEYDKSSKDLEIEKIQKKIDNSEVLSTAAGVVKELNNPKTKDDNSSSYGENDATISIMMTGNYRVKGTLDEQTINMVTPGSSVIVRSRVDETQTWRGTVDRIDTGETATDESEDSMMYEGESDSSNSATKYPFYITLEETDGLLLGQHVLIELDEGQMEVKEGLWLYESYIVMEGGESLNQGNLESAESTESLGNVSISVPSLGDAGTDAGTGAYVWADDGNGRLIKKPVELGEYDEMLGEYQILSGLTEDDLITWPMAGLYEGVTTVTNEEDVDYSSDLYNMEDGTESMWDEGDYGTESMWDEGDYGTESMWDEGDDYGTEMMPLDDGDTASDEDSDEDEEDVVTGEEVRASWEEGNGGIAQ